MKTYLEKIAPKTLKNTGASTLEIQKLEEKLGVTLPTEYKKFLSITNGIEIPSYTEPNFVATENVMWLKNALPELIDAYSFDDEYSVGKELKNSILITEIDAEQYFLLILPTPKTDWKFWKFANWIPGEEPYKNLKTYFKEVVEIIEEENE